MQINKDIVPRSIPQGMQELFVSWHWSDMAKQQQGYGCSVLAVDMNLYRDSKSKLIIDLMKQTKIITDSKFDTDADVEILNFK